MIKTAIALSLFVGLAGTVMAGEPGPNDTGGTPLRGPEPLVERPVGSWPFARNCDDERLPDYDPHNPACEEQDVPVAAPTQPPAPTPTIVVVEPPTPMMRPMAPCTRGHCDD